MKNINEPSVKIQSTFTSEIHGCRVLKSQKIPGILYVACYEYSQETNSRKGAILKLKIKDNFELIKEESPIFEYGILDFKLIHNSNGQEAIIGCTSKGNIIVLNFKLLENSESIENKEIKNLNNPKKIFDEMVSTNQSTALCIEANSKRIITTGHLDGSLSFFDINSSTPIKTLPKHHEFEIWSLYFENNNIIFSGSDDYSIKAYDINSDKIILMNIDNLSGVTCIKKIKDNLIATGSYDGTILFFDLRKMSEKNSYLQKFKISQQVWDFSLYPTKNEEFIGTFACIYYGFEIGKLDKNFNIQSKRNLLVESDQSLAYGVDTINENESYICTFYNNQIMKIQY